MGHIHSIDWDSNLTVISKEEGENCLRYVFLETVVQVKLHLGKN